jgi:hypothetical protein
MNRRSASREPSLPICLRAAKPNSISRREAFSISKVKLGPKKWPCPEGAPLSGRELPDPSTPSQLIPATGCWIDHAYATRVSRPAIVLAYQAARDICGFALVVSPRRLRFRMNERQLVGRRRGGLNGGLWVIASRKLSAQDAQAARLPISPPKCTLCSVAQASLKTMAPCLNNITIVEPRRKRPISSPFFNTMF